MSEQQLPVITQECLAPAGYQTWRDYWTAQGMPWRIESEIDDERQRYLAERRTTIPDIEKSIYPFKDVRLDRGDVEWLLATHDSRGVQGPVEWEMAGHHYREGIDLRGALLHGVSLDNLPLARMKGGLSGAEFDNADVDQRMRAGFTMNGGSLRYTRLEGAALNYAQLEAVSMFEAHLEATEFYGALLAREAPANLGHAYFDYRTRLDRIRWHTSSGYGPIITGIHWGGVNVTSVDWSLVRRVHDEEYARKRSTRKAKSGVDTRLHAYERAVQAYRQLAIVLRSQGVHEDADRFAYRAQLCQRVVLRRKRKFLRYFGSLALDLVSGYGYRPLRSLIVYIFVILAFAASYFVLGSADSQALSWNEAIIISMTAFHGRGFFSSAFHPGDFQAALAAVEALLGLLIEIILIATFTQRFFAR